MNNNENKKIAIIIARYNEDLDWIKNIPDFFDIYVYNKGATCKLPQKKNLILQELENIGRESHTYLTHIINNFNNLHDINIFCQGDSITHNKDFLKLLTKYYLFEPIQPLSSYYVKTSEYDSTPPIELLYKTKYLEIDKIPTYLDYNNYFFKTVYPIYYTNISLDIIINKIQEKYNLIDYIINELGLKNIDKNYLIPVSYAGIFSVNNKLILNNDINFYKKILNYLLYDKQIDGVDNGFIIERLWMSVFNYQKYNSHYKKIESKKFIIDDKILKIKNNYFYFDVVLVCENIYITFKINNTINKLYIGKKLIYYKGFANYFFKKKPKSLKEYLKPIKLNIKVFLNNNILEIYINNHNFLNIDIFLKKIVYKKNHNNVRDTNNYLIEDAVLYNILFYNNFKDNNIKK